MPLRSLIVATLLLASAWCAPAAPAAAETLQDWAQRMHARSIQVSAGLWDLESGKLLDSCEPDRALVPASTTKVLSTYAILRLLKPDHELRTEVWGDLQGSTVTGDLVFRGGGDPYLTSERIWLLAQELRARGVRQVTGAIRLDQSAFDGQRYGNGWEHTSVSATPPVLPLSVNGNRENGRLVTDPERLALEVLDRVLRESGIAIQGQPAQGGPPRLLLSFPSEPLRNLVVDINKVSDNFAIEMLVKHLGGGSWPEGVRAIQSFYATALGLGPDKVAITDGSGLSKANRISAKTLAIVLRSAWNDFEVGPELVSSLKTIGGEPWKLRISDPNLARRVRCKTGHLAGVVAVCGYLQTLDGHLRVFAVLLNGPAQEWDAWEWVSRWAN